MTVDERVTRQFREWARIGQGGLVFPYRVGLEPPFRPFRGYDLSTPNRVDDGVRPTFLSSLARSLMGASAPVNAQAIPEEPDPPAEYCRGEVVDVEILISERDTPKMDRFAQFLSVLTFCAEPISLELLGTEKGVSVILSANVDDMDRVEEQLTAFFPRALCVPRTAPTVCAWHAAEGNFAALAEFSLSREFMLPLGRPPFDPYVALVGVLGGVREGECAIFQVLVAPVSNPWGEHALRSVSGAGDKPLFVNAPELYAGAREKIQSPLYASTVRALSRAATPERAESIMAGVVASLHACDGENRLVGHPVIVGIEDGIEDVLFRETRRSGMILSADEVTLLAHVPTAEVISPRLIRQTKTTRAAPSFLIGAHNGVRLGDNEHAGRTVSVTLPAEVRTRHMHVIGASGTGKSTLLYNLIREDIEAGRGVGVFDPHGDLIDRVLGAVPKERVGDVVLLDPADPEFAIGFNILRAHSDLEKTLLASDLVSVFERLSTSWGDQMGSVLSNAIMAFLESTRGGSLLDLRRFLVEPAFRAEFLKTVSDPEVSYYWRTAFPLLTGNKSVGPILTRLDAFLAPKSIRQMVGQRENRLDFADIMDSGKIFMAKLSEGAIGRENSHLLGSLLFSKFQQLSVARQAQATTERRDFFLYADEFQNFATPSLAEILSGGRKYRLGLILAHQELRQLERCVEVASAVMGNAGTRVVFRVGDADARTLALGFGHFEAADIQSLGTGEAICRVEKRDDDFNLAVRPPEDLPDAADRADAARNASQARYGAKRETIEAEMRAQVPVVAEEKPKAAIVAQTPPPVARPAPPESPKVKPPPPMPDPTPGRGGREHKYLQAFIKQWAEGMGWRASVEAPVTGGTGSVDVLLTKGAVSVACEISVTTSPEHEMCNLGKCLVAGYTHVVSVSADAKKAALIRDAAREKLSEGEFARVRFFDPRELFAFVSEMDAKNAATEKTVKGYRVKVSYRPVDAAAREEKVVQLAVAVAKSLKRKRGEP